MKSDEHEFVSNYMSSGVILVSNRGGHKFLSDQMGTLDINLAFKIRQGEIPTLPPTK